MPKLKLPKAHSGQIEIANARVKLNAIRCGRRFGKTKLLVMLAAHGAAAGKKVGIFTPEHKQLQEPYEELLDILQPIKRRASKTEGTIRTTNGGIIDFWSLIDNDLAGRGREYDLILIDEGAFTKNIQMLNIWERSIKPTMLTRPNSEAWVFSTPNGIDPDNFFWRICNDAEYGFKEFSAPTSKNPYVPADELERERSRCHPLVFQQEFLAEFTDFSSAAFFTEDKMLVGGHAVEYPRGCASVFATVDSAVKDGKQHDGTAVCFWSYDPHSNVPMILLDWDIIQIQGAMLETWLPTVFQRLESLSVQCSARMGSMGTYIEDKASGSVLLQQAANRGWPAQPLPSKLTALGKDERALSVSGYAYQGLMKISRVAYEKTTEYKGATRNHFLSQVCGFRLGAKPGAADDILDCYTYALAICLGNSEGF